MEFDFVMSCTVCLSECPFSNYYVSLCIVSAAHYIIIILLCIQYRRIYGYQCLDGKLFQPVGTCPIGPLLLHYNEWRGGHACVGEVQPERWKWSLGNCRRADGQGLSNTRGTWSDNFWMAFFPKAGRIVSYNSIKNMEVVNSLLCGQPYNIM